MDGGGFVRRSVGRRVRLWLVKCGQFDIWLGCDRLKLRQDI